MLRKLLLALAFIYTGVLNSSAMVTDDHSELEHGIPQLLKMLYRAPEINLGETIGHLFLEMTVTQQHYRSEFAVVNPDEIGGFFQNHRLSNDIITGFAALKLKPLYYEYVYVGECENREIFTDNGWQIRYGYAAIINNIPLTIKISPKTLYVETIRKNKMLAAAQRETLRDAFSQLKQSVSAIPPGEKREQAKAFLSHVKKLTEATLSQLKEMATDWPN